jgi:uncharacterized glyoxalase superfamily protein PhnB
MLGSVADSEFARLLRQPDEIGGAETQTVYVVVPDADAHYARATAAGAKVVMEIKDEDYTIRGRSSTANPRRIRAGALSRQA